MSGNLAMKLEVPQRVPLLVVETLLSTDPFNVLTLTVRIQSYRSYDSTVSLYMYTYVHIR